MPMDPKFPVKVCRSVHLQITSCPTIYANNDDDDDECINIGIYTDADDDDNDWLGFWW